MTDRKDRIRIQIDGQEFNLVGGNFQDMLAAVKQINGRRFVSELKVWQLPGPVEDVQRQFEISSYWLEGGAPAANKSPAPAAPASAGGDRIRVLVEGQRLAVVGGNFQDMLALVKSLPGRRFDGETKLWEIPGDPEVIKGMVEAAGFQLEGAAKFPARPVPPMEPPDFLGTRGSHAALPLEEPDLLDDDEPPEPPPWWDDELNPLPPEDDRFDEPFEAEPPSLAGRPVAGGPVVATGGRRSGDRIRIRLGGIPLVVSGGEFQAILTLVKSIPGRRFNGDERVWELPDTLGLESLGQRVAAAGFVLEQE
ncbi:MAG: hypothetical protein HYR94_08655 [Chloroflexi bacterium]|nr:hypothetical protein [Chloroflexota bacterium]